MKKLLLSIVLFVLALTPAAFAATGTSANSMTLSVGAEASITIGSATALTGAGNFANYAGSTAFTYKIRTTPTSGSGNITVQVTTDFSPAGGPSVATPPTAGDALTYTCSASGTSSPTACASAMTASTTATTSVLTVGADAHSAFAGDTGSLAWTLTNDPKYKVGSYTATVTFTVTAL